VSNYYPRVEFPLDETDPTQFSASIRAPGGLTFLRPGKYK